MLLLLGEVVADQDLAVAVAVAVIELQLYQFL
jgi:hypothetical protein